jgi:hypothetical protein|tara:strand:+ start:337 stop:567 length:231 start_codon:yes stop_codon:yes gene_type:complete
MKKGFEINRLGHEISEIRTYRSGKKFTKTYQPIESYKDESGKYVVQFENEKEAQEKVNQLNKTANPKWAVSPFVIF